jgi:GNAT superfamily N-acetyltransferase
MAEVPEEVAYEIRTSSSPEKIEGCPWQIPNYEKPTFFVIWVDNEPVGQIGFVNRNNKWWNDYAYIRKDMQGKGVYRLLLKEIYYREAQITDFVWANAVNTRPEDHYRRQKFYGVTVEIKGISYKGFPIPLEKWPEFQHKYNINNPKDVTTLHSTDLRSLKNTP